MRISDWSSDVCSSDLRAVDGDRAAAAAGEVHRRLADGQMKVGAREHLGLPERLQRPRATGPPPHAGDGTTNRQSLHKTATRQIRPNAGDFDRHEIPLLEISMTAGEACAEHPIESRGRASLENGTATEKADGKSGEEGKSGAAGGGHEGGGI